MVSSPLPGAVDAWLHHFDEHGLTARLCRLLLDTVPHGDPLPRAADLEAVVRSVAPGADAAVIQRTRAPVEDPVHRKVLLLLAGLDAKDGIGTIASSIRTALALYQQRQSLGPAGTFESSQAADAALKLLVIGDTTRRLFTGTPAERVNRLFGTHAGRALGAYFAVAEIAIPFLDETQRDGMRVIGEVIDPHKAEQVRRLRRLVGIRSAAETERILPVLMPPLSRLVEASAAHLAPLVSRLTAQIPKLASAAGGVVDLAAQGADLLPIYRFLGLRLVTEVAARQAAGEAGLEVREPSAAWNTRFLKPPEPPAVLHGSDVASGTEAALQSSAAEAPAPPAAAPAPPEAPPAPPEAAPLASPEPPPAPPAAERPHKSGPRQPSFPGDRVRLASVSAPASVEPKQHHRRWRLVAGLLIVAALACGLAGMVGAVYVWQANGGDLNAIFGQPAAKSGPAPSERPISPTRRRRRPH